MENLAKKLGHILIPMITPFKEGSEDVNYDVAAALADRLASADYCDTIIVAGTTGEFNTLMFDERVELMRVVKNAVAGRVQLVAGTGAASTRESVLLTKEAEKLGYETVMVVAPYYCKPSQEGIYRHYKTVANSTGADVMLYNIPIFTGVNISPDTVKRLSEIKNIRGIKDEAGLNPTQMTEYRRATSEEFTIYNGDDIMVLCGLVQGAAGIVSGGSHLVGKQMRQMINAFVSGDLGLAQKIHHQLDPLFKSFCPNGRVNPMPVLRAAVEMAGIPVGPARRPLDTATDEEKALVRVQLERLNVL